MTTKEPPLSRPAPRTRREQRTIEAMIALACHDRHGTQGALCPECRELRGYAAERLARCPFGANKPTCAHCRVHCYRQEMRDRVRSVMRYAGPKMLLRHPVLTLLHMLVDGRREAPRRPSRRATGAVPERGSSAATGPV